MKQIDQILELLEGHSGNRHLVVLHEYPDPDAIASGYAHRQISVKFDIEVDILYTGEISHQQNLALVRALDYDFIKYEESMDLTPYSGAVLVDHQGSTVSQIIDRLEEDQVPLLIIVDHHEQQEHAKASFEDIRKTGSTSTIYSQYLQAMNWLEQDQKEHVLSSTALMHGILTDTGGFIQASEEDFHAAAYLSKYHDAQLLNLIMNQTRSKHVMEIIQHALGNRVLVESFSMAGLGYLRAEDRDAIPEVADFLLTEDNVHTAIAYGIVKDDMNNETLVGSMRTSKFTINPDEFIKDVFGTDFNGKFFGGGKISAGGFSIPVGFLSGAHHDHYEEIKWQVYDEQIKHKVLNKIGIDSKQLWELEDS